MNRKALLAQLISSKYQLILAFAFNKLHDHELSEDIAQETIFKALVNRSKFRDKPTESNVQMWMYAIARNLVVDEYRGRKRHTEVELKPAHKTAVPTLRKFIVEDLHKAIANLPEPLDEEMLDFLNGFPYEEIAERHDLPLGTVKSHLFRAKSILLNAMTELGYAEFYPPMEEKILNRHKRGEISYLPDTRTGTDS